ncbi:MAG: hypothetical protein V5A88_10145 [Candidatus Thermoplasmatota archaeon]
MISQNDYICVCGGGLKLIEKKNGTSATITKKFKCRQCSETGVAIEDRRSHKVLLKGVRKI